MWMLIFLSMIAGTLGANAAAGVSPHHALPGWAGHVAGAITGYLICLFGTGWHAPGWDELEVLTATLVLSTTAAAAYSILLRTAWDFLRR